MELARDRRGGREGPPRTYAGCDDRQDRPWVFSTLGRASAVAAPAAASRLDGRRSASPRRPPRRRVRNAPSSLTLLWKLDRRPRAWTAGRDPEGSSVSW